MNHSIDQRLNEIEIEYCELVFYNFHHIKLIAQTFERPIYGICGWQVYSRILIWNGFEYVGCVMAKTDEKLNLEQLKPLLREVRLNLTKHRFV